MDNQLSIPNLYTVDNQIESCLMDFPDWLMAKFKEWEARQVKGRSSFTAFARYLGVKQPSLTRWLAGDNPPDAENIIKMAEKLGPEIYDVLSFPQPNLGGSVKIPLLGRVRAGEPIPVPPSDFSHFDPESTIDVAHSWLPKKIKTTELYALEVEGDSMIDMGIEDRTTIVLKKQETAENGDIVVACFDDDTRTLKRFFRENGHIRLQPENLAYKPIIVDAEKVHIFGKVVMLIRTFE